MARYAGAVLALLVVTAACTDSGTSLPTTTTSTAAPPPVPTTTSTTAAAAPTTTEPPPESITYLVVAEESDRRLAVIESLAAGERCEENEPGPCGRFALVERFDLPHPPHNLAAEGSVVLATHWRAGAVSRLDLATGEVLTVSVGMEPHDVKIADGIAYVADDAGRALLQVDLETLAVVDQVSLPYRPHDLYVAGDAIWVTMLGTDRFAVVADGQVDLVPTGRTPHDLLVTEEGVWFSNWGSHELNILNPVTGEVERAPAGVVEPHHFAVDADGVVWVSDNGGDSVVAFGAETLSVVVGRNPHHLAPFGTAMAVAVSGTGEAVFIEGGRVVGRVPLSTGLHGVAVVSMMP